MKNKININRINQRIVKEATIANDGLVRMISALSGVDNSIVKIFLDSESPDLPTFFDGLDNFVSHYKNNRSIIKKYNKKK